VQNSSPRFLEILKLLTRYRIDFIVVGGVSAVLHGAPVTTFDLDVVHARNRENIARLLSALDELEAVYRIQPERQLRPAESHLASPGHQLLLTKFGPLDVLGMIGKSRTWEDLRPYTRTMEIEPDVVVRVLNLEMLIAVKEELGFPKDIAVLPLLRQALKERSERQR
jgi:uncharacterized protein YqcC (DUF446 family)